jgi:flagellar L-ring protein precursor FlgH
MNMRLVFCAIAALCAGCANFGTPKVDIAEPTTALPQAQPQPVISNGAIFQAAQYRPLFEDHRARLVGDTITVQIVEKVSASQKSTSTVDKSGTVDASLTAVPFLKPSALTRSSAGGSSNNSFTGKGSTENSNNFSGTITAVVTGVLPNGHLLIAGEKQIGVNENVDVLRFSGQVDPRAILPGNSVQSAQIANVRIEHRGRGQQAEAQGIGWLARFFLSVLPI